MGYVGWSSVANQANTTTGGAESVVADVSVEVDVGRGMGGAGVVNRFSSIPPTPPVSFGFIEIESGFMPKISWWIWCVISFALFTYALYLNEQPPIILF
jgi:hypothetical protein